MAEPQIAITGYGCLTAAGADATATWRAVLQGSSGIERARSWDSTGWPYGLAAEIKDYQPRKLIPDRKLLKVISRQDVIGLNAVAQALEHSGIIEYRESLEDPSSLNDRTGVFVGSPATKYRHQHDYLSPIAGSGADTRDFGLRAMDEVHPMWLLRALPNNVLAYVGIGYGFKGANANVTAHGVSGSQAIAEACRYLRDGAIDRAVVVAYDSASELEAIPYYASVGLLSERGLKPFDRDRDGTVLGEGAGALVLERRSAAEQRGAAIHAQILGSSVVSEAQGVLSIREDGDGLRRAIRLALEGSGTEPGEVGLICAHANGTRPSDASEARVYAELFGQSSVPVTGFKWCLGHTIAASGVVETILTLLCLEHGRVPGIASLQQLAPDCEGINARASEQRVAGRLGLVVSRGFAGLNSCIVLAGDEVRSAS
jgi:3-oxoacyl-[acyl-carrier-protein] synthase-1